MDSYGRMSIPVTRVDVVVGDLFFFLPSFITVYQSASF
jgi:hypothetical protein